MRIPRWSGVLVLTAALAGCPPPSSVRPGTSHLYALPVRPIWDVVEGSLAELNYAPDVDRHDDEGGVLHARRNDVGGLTVRAAPWGDAVTQVSVVADAANRDAEEEVFARIDAHLERPPPGRPVPTSFLDGR